MMEIEQYKEQFEKLGKADLFELNKPFIEEIVLLKKKIVKTRELIGDNSIIVHPNSPGRIRVSEGEIWLSKLLDQYKNMTVALNRIIGDVDEGEDDPLEDWINEHSGHTE